MAVKPLNLAQIKLLRTLNEKSSMFVGSRIRTAEILQEAGLVESGLRCKSLIESAVGRRADFSRAFKRTPRGTEVINEIDTQE